MLRLVKTQTRHDFFGAIFSGALVLFFSLLLLWHDPLVFWNDDYQISILPVFADIARSWSEGHLPLLSPYSWVCGNLAGEFQYGTFSVFINLLVVLIWKLPLKFAQQAAALSMAHLFVLATGSYLLARGRKISHPLATMVALVAALNGWIICWGASDWFGALSAFAWLPWAWWGMERALDASRGPNRFIWPAPFVYLLVTGGFPYTVLMMGVLVGWLVLHSLGRTRSVLVPLPMLLGVLAGIGLAAPAWLALFDYIHGSGRESQAASAHFQWVVPVAALPAFILPTWTVNWADFQTRLTPHTGTELACGLVPPIALLAGLIQSKLRLVRYLKWELALLLVVLLIAMLPTANVFRWSFRWLPLFHLILALCAAEALPTLRRATAGSTACVAVVVTILLMFLLRTTGPHAFPFVWMALGLAVTWLAGELLITDNHLKAWLPATITFCSLLSTYFFIPTNCGVPKYAFTEKLLQPAPLDPNRHYLGFYPPPEVSYRSEQRPNGAGEVVRPGSTSMWARLRFVNGYSPIRPSGVAKDFGIGIHGEVSSGMDEYLAHWQAGPDGLLAELGVDGLVVAKEIDLTLTPAQEWELVHSSDEGKVFHRRGKPLQAIRSVTSLESRPKDRFAPATISRIVEERNGLSADVDAAEGSTLPIMLVVSRPYFPGYQATIDGMAAKVSSYKGLIPTVEVPAGTHGRLSLQYRPWWLIYGGAISILSLLVLLVALIRGVAAQYTSRL